MNRESAENAAREIINRIVLDGHMANLWAVADIIERACGQDAVTCGFSEDDALTIYHAAAMYTELAAREGSSSDRDAALNLVRLSDKLEETKAGERSCGETAPTVCPECDGKDGKHRELFVKTGQSGFGEVDGYYRECRTGQKMAALPSPPTGRANAEEGKEPSQPEGMERGK